MKAIPHLSSNSFHLALGESRTSKGQFRILSSWEKSPSQSTSKCGRIARLSDPHQTTHRCCISQTDDTSSAKTNVAEREQTNCRCHASRRQRICTQRYGRSHEQNSRRFPLAGRRRGGSREQSGHRQARSSRGAPTWECEGSTRGHPRRHPSRRLPLARRQCGESWEQSNHRRAAACIQLWARGGGSREQSDYRQTRSSWGAPTWECEGSMRGHPRRHPSHRLSLARRNSRTTVGQTGTPHGQAIPCWGGTPPECQRSLSRSPGKRPGPVHEEAFGSECSGGTGLEAGHDGSSVRMAAVRRLGPWTPMVRERSMSAVREGPVTNVA